MRGEDMAFPIPSTDSPSRLDYSAAIKALSSGLWLANRLCVNPAVAHEVINMMHPGLLAPADARRRR